MYPVAAYYKQTFLFLGLFQMLTLSIKANDLVTLTLRHKTLLPLGAFLFRKHTRFIACLMQLHIQNVSLRDHFVSLFGACLSNFAF